MTQLGWFESFAVLNPNGLFPLAYAFSLAVSVLGVSAFRNRGAMLARRNLADSPELQDIVNSERGTVRFHGERLEIASEAEWAMTALTGRAAAKGVTLKVALVPGLAVWMDKRSFRRLLVELISRAIADAACGHVLLTGCRHGGRVQIAVSHDGPPASREMLEAALRSSTEIAALNGGTLEVKICPGQGATVLVRMPEPAAASTPVSAPTAPALVYRQSQRTLAAIASP